MTKEQLYKIFHLQFPHIDKNYIEEFFRLYNLYSYIFKDKNRLAIFLANLLAEIDVKRNGKVRLRENMNYSCKRALQIPGWKRRIKRAEKKGIEWCKTNGYVKPKILANIVYSNRLGNGDFNSKEGEAYIGLGGLQITGKNQYLKMFKTFKKHFGINLDFLVSHPAMVNSVFNNYTMNILSAFAYWIFSGMSKAKTIDKAIDIINKYTNSRKKRKKLYKKILKII